MFGPGLGGLELVVVAIVALIVVGPKDLPVMLRTLGQFVRRMRNMAADFRDSFDEMARQSELDDLRKEVEALRSGQYLDKQLGSPGEVFSDIDGELRGKGNGADPYAPEPTPMLDYVAPPEPEPLSYFVPPAPTAEPSLETEVPAREPREAQA